MMKFKKLFAVLLVTMCVSAIANAQENKKDYEPYPYMFVGVQGGVQDTLILSSTTGRHLLLLPLSVLADISTM